MVGASLMSRGGCNHEFPGELYCSITGANGTIAFRLLTEKIFSWTHESNGSRAGRSRPRTPLGFARPEDLRMLRRHNHGQC